VRVELIVEMDEKVDLSRIDDIDLWIGPVRFSEGKHLRLKSVRRLPSVDEVQTFAERVKSWLRNRERALNGERRA